LRVNLVKMYDVLCVGGANIDVFVDTENRLFQEEKKGKIHIPFGSKVLVKKIRFDTGGGGSNTAVAFSRFGLTTGFIGNVGDDENSRQIVDALEKENVDTSMTVNRGHSGYSVILDAYEHDRTILVFKGSNNDFKYSDIDLKKLLKNKPKFFYFGTMLETAYKTQEKLAAFAQKNKIKVALNASTYLAAKGLHFVSALFKNIDVLILNYEEAKLFTGQSIVSKQMAKLHKSGPKIVCITEGPKGAYCSNGFELYFVRAQKVRIVETTGAGDAFASGFIAGMIKNKPIDYCLQLGQVEAESVISHMGAKEKLLSWKEITNKINRKPPVVRKKNL
ncbi:carbohydrate kinase family protein, partial [Candidatus Woesearchaeota archaeon]|nr:carbohydrate kinase family protein [Candidatus Woesearchaeota archaeon]